MHKIVPADPRSHLLSLVCEVVGIVVVAACVVRGVSLLADLRATLDDLAAGLEQLQSLLHEGVRVGAELTILTFAKGIVTDAERALVGESARHLTLQIVLGLADNAGVVNETVLGRVLLGLEGAEQSLLGAKNLNGGRRLLGQVHKAT